MSTSTDRRLNVYINGVQADSTLKQLKIATRKFKNELANLSPASDEFVKKSAKLEKVNKRIGDLNSRLRSTGGLFGRLQKSVKQTAGLFLGGLGIQAGIRGIDAFIDKNSKLDASLTQVQKTTGLARDEVADLDSDLRNFDTSSVQDELLDIAAVGGRLDIAKDDLDDFVLAVDKVNVALGDELAGGAEGIATSMGKIRNSFKETRNENIGKALEKIGSSVNALSNKTSASAQPILDFTQRIGQLPGAFKPAIESTLSLAAVVGEAGLSTEIASRGYGIFIKAAATDLESFAKQMGITKDAASELLNTDPAQFLAKFSQALDGLDAEETSAILKDLKINQDGVQKLVGAMSTRYERFGEVLKENNKDFKDAVSISEEFALANNTLPAIIQKIKKTWSNFITSPEVVDGLRSWAQKVLDFVRALGKVPAFIKANKEELVFLAAALISIKYGKVIGESLKFSSVLGNQVAVLRRYVRMQGVATVSVATFRGAIKLLSKAIMANPIGVVALAIYGLIEAVKAYDKYNSESVRLEREKKAALEETKLATTVLSTANLKLRNDVRDLNKLSVEEKKLALENAAAILEVAKARLIDAKAKRKQVFDDNQRVTVLQRLKNLITSGGNFGVLDINNTISKLENASNATKDLDAEISNLDKTYKALGQTELSLQQTLGSESEADRMEADNVVDNVAAIREQIGLYQTALDHAALGSEEYLRILEKIEKAEKRLRKSSGSGNGGSGGKKQKSILIDWESELAQGEKGLQDIQDLVEDWTEKREGEQKGKHQREIDTLNAKYDKQLEVAKTHLKDLAALEAAGLDLKRNEELDGAGSESEKDEINKKYDAQVQLLQKYQDTVDEIEGARADEIKLVEEQEIEEALAKGQEFLDQIFGQKTSAKDRELEAAFNEYNTLRDEYDRLHQDKTKIHEAFQKKIQDINEKHKKLEKKNADKANKEARERRLDEVDSVLNTATKIGEIGVSLIDFLVKNADNAAAFKKGLALFDITVETAKAIASAIRVAIDGSISPIDMIFKIATTIGAVISNMARANKLLNSANKPAAPATASPSFEQGTILGGSRHSDGGNAIIDRRTGREEGEVEEGELIASRKFVQKNPKLVQAILQAGKQGGEMPKDWYLNSPSYTQTSTLSRGIKASQGIYEKGGLFKLAKQVLSPKLILDERLDRLEAEGASAAVPVELTEAIEALNKNLESGIEAVLKDETVVELSKRQEELESIESEESV